MNSEVIADRVVVIIGAGPAGIFAAGRFAEAGVRVLLLNRDIKPGGLVEYGIYPDKYRLKNGIRRQIKKALASPLIRYRGHVAIGDERDLSLASLRALKPSAILVTAGAQGTHALEVEGEDRPGVYQAKELVYHYTGLPPFAARDIAVGRRALIIGMGNVAIDIAHWLVRDKAIGEVTIMARRGPAERKYTAKELAPIGANLDRAALDAEMDRIAPTLRAVGQDPEDLLDEIYAELEKHSEEKTTETRVRFAFLESAAALLGSGSSGAVERVRIEANTLVNEDGFMRCVGLGQFREEAFDMVIPAVGDRIDDGLGLPCRRGRFHTDKGEPSGLDSFRLCDPDSGAGLENLFAAGWSRRASVGLVGVAKHDGINAAEAILGWLADQPEDPGACQRVEAGIEEALKSRGTRVVSKAEVEALERSEAALAKEKGLEEARYLTNDEMFAAIDREPAGSGAG